ARRHRVDERGRRGAAARAGPGRVAGRAGPARADGAAPPAGRQPALPRPAAPGRPRELVAPYRPRTVHRTRWARMYEIGAGGDTPGAARRIPPGVEPSRPERPPTRSVVPSSYGAPYEVGADVRDRESRSPTGRRRGGQRSNFVDRMIDVVVRSTPSRSPMRSVSRSIACTPSATTIATRSWLPLTECRLRTS